jgi:Tol biopolymer transport system component
MFRKGKSMLRLQTLFLTICLLIISFQPVFGQYEREAGKLLFKNVLSPSTAGPGKVAFLRLDPKHPGGQIELYLGDMKTLTEARALPGVGFGTSVGMLFAWSPDGSEFVIPKLTNGCWELFRYKSGSRAGEQISQLIQFRETKSDGMLRDEGITEEQLLMIAELTYSPSGKRILFMMDRPAGAALWWIDPQTGITRQAIEDQAGAYGYFAPDDDHISYTIVRTKGAGTLSATEDIVLRSLKSGVIDTLTNSPDNEFSGVISPDGKYLAYVVTTANINNLWVMNLASRQSRQFTFATSGKNCTTPSWTPDSRQIVFFGVGFAPQPSVFVKDFVPF